MSYLTKSTFGLTELINCKKKKEKEKILPSLISFVLDAFCYKPIKTRIKVIANKITNKLLREVALQTNLVQYEK